MKSLASLLVLVVLAAVSLSASSDGAAREAKDTSPATQPAAEGKSGPDLRRQDDIIVKPGGGGNGPRRLIWVFPHKGVELKAGKSHELRDDLLGPIGTFKLWDAMGTERNADWVTFTVSDPQDGDQTVTIRAVNNDFQWTYVPPRTMSACLHKPNQCENDGIPRHFQTMLIGNITGQYTDPNGVAVPVADVQQFELWGQ